MRRSSRHRVRLARCAAVGASLWASLVGAVPAGAQPGLVALPLDDPAYVQLEALHRVGCAPARVSAYRPFLVRLVRAALDSAAGDAGCAGRILDALRDRFAADTGAVARLRWGAALTVAGTALGRGEIRPLWQDVRPTAEGEPAGAVTARGRATYGDTGRYVVVAEVVAGTHRRNQTQVRQKALRNTSGYVDGGDAYISARFGPFVASLGRMAEAWAGSGRESLILSAHGPPLDRVQLEAHWSRLEGRAFFGSLDDVVLTEAEDSIGAGISPVRRYRMLAGHALTWRPHPALELSVGETALITRGSRVLDLAFVNPFVPYLLTQNDSSRTGAEQEDNLLVFGAAVARVAGVLISGELVVDDIQIDAADRERLNDQLAWSLRAAVPLPMPMPVVLGAEYTRVGTYTYLRNPYSVAYQQFGRPLGSELGPDADVLRLTAEAWPHGKARLGASVGLWRHGALRLEDRPGRSVNEGRRAFPSTDADRPGVQSGLLADASVRLLDVRLPLAVRIEAANVHNVNNLDASPALYVRAQILGTYAFRYP
ncbi:MAG TPA: hypothetical protein VNA89_03565 [Gemmatimonadaceae bacterium]|nr:hypothetical protein [Gemmatimonadaceae bacterium]